MRRHCLLLNFPGEFTKPMLLLDERRTVKTLPVFLKGHEDNGPQTMELIRKSAVARGPLSKPLDKRFAEMAKYSPSGKKGK